MAVPFGLAIDGLGGFAIVWPTLVFEWACLSSVLLLGPFAGFTGVALKRFLVGGCLGVVCAKGSQCTLFWRRLVCSEHLFRRRCCFSCVFVICEACLFVIGMFRRFPLCLNVICAVLAFIHVGEARSM